MGLCWFYKRSINHWFTYNIKC